MLLRLVAVSDASNIMLLRLAALSDANNIMLFLRLAALSDANNIMLLLRLAALSDIGRIVLLLRLAALSDIGRIVLLLRLAAVSDIGRIVLLLRLAALSDAPHIHHTFPLLYMFRPDGAIFRYIRSHNHPFFFSATVLWYICTMNFVDGNDNKTLSYIQYGAEVQYFLLGLCRKYELC
jgi:hypothetical protein